MIKCITTCDITRDALLTSELDSDACVGSDEKNTIAIDVSLRKLDSRDICTPKVRLLGVTTDSRGGGRGFGLEKQLEGHDRLDEE